MNQPPSDDGDDAMDRRFQTGLREDGGPSEAVRRAILDHANRMAAEHARSQPRGRRSAMLGARRRNTIFGTLAAAAFAGLLVLPILRAPFNPTQSAAGLPPTSEALPAPAPAPAPQPEAVGRSEKTESAAGAQPKIAAGAAEPKGPTRQAANPFNVASQAKGIASTTVGAAAAPPAGPAVQPSATPSAAQAGTRASAADAAAPIAAAPAQPSRNLARAAISPFERGESLRGAAAAGDVAAVNALLSSTSDVDARDRSGRTALMLAILNGHVEMVEALLAHGADANAVDLAGARPLQMARAAGNREIVDSLLRAGAQ
ncbi:MAG TPA: ankyrin repeat domain-containing protein [Steroidobacteraceae bacterium]|jgi:hypothetical protein|nr:ankyrin repeat domain-containing protein [Steroidobacteraceae bacterium]